LPPGPSSPAIQLIVPVGLDKLIPSVKKAVSRCGRQTLDYAQGSKVGLIPLAGATVVTEIEALRVLAGVEAVHVASGGNDRSEGAVTLVAEGPAFTSMPNGIERQECIGSRRHPRPLGG
jgi:hypothetical protein